MGFYRHDWDLGIMRWDVTPVHAMAIIQNTPNRVFPFTVKGRNGETSIKFGSLYDLINTYGPFDNFLLGADPVVVTAVGATSFTFTTLEGHHRGAGQTITFETYDKIGQDPGHHGLQYSEHVYLAQYGTFISSWRHPFSSLFNYAANVGASGAWALQAHNLREALGTAGQFEDWALPGRRTVWPLPSPATHMDRPYPRPGPYPRH